MTMLQAVKEREREVEGAQIKIFSFMRDDRQLLRICDQWMDEMFYRRNCGYWCTPVGRSPCSSLLVVVENYLDGQHPGSLKDADKAFISARDEWVSAGYYYCHDEYEGYLAFSPSEVIGRAVSLFLLKCAERSVDALPAPSFEMDTYIQRAIFGRVKYG